LIVKQTFNIAMVTGVLTHESIYPLITDDNCPKAEDFDVSVTVSDTANYYLAVYDDDGTLGGMIDFLMINHIVYEGHINMLRHCRGDKAIRAVKMALEWMFSRTSCLRIVTKVASCFGSAKTLVETVGGKEEYSIEKSCKRGGVEYDQAFYAINLHDHIHLDWERYYDEGVTFFNQFRKTKLSRINYIMGGMFYVFAQTGNHEKAQMIYNEWARLAVAEPIDVLVVTGDNALVIKIGEDIVIMDDGHIEPKEGKNMQNRMAG